MPPPLGQWCKQIFLIEPLWVSILQEGNLVYELPALDEIRKQRQADLKRLDSGVRRLLNPHIYHVSLSPNLWQLKQRLIADFKAQSARS